MQHTQERYGVREDDMKTIQLARSSLVATVDDEDYEMLSHFRWRLSGNGYACAVLWIDGARASFRMHRIILNAPTHLLVDHRDRDRLNNTRANLRLCSFRQNAGNAKKSVRGSSRFKGVSRIKSGKFKARIHADGISKHLGTFDSELDAHNAYVAAARIVFGEFARAS